MNRVLMSAAASALLRALIARAAVPRDRILLSDVHSVEWRSLTFSGERHWIELRVAGPDSGTAIERMCVGLEEAEFDLAGMFVADIRIASPPLASDDGSTTATIEALTISAD